MGHVVVGLSGIARLMVCHDAGVSRQRGSEFFAVGRVCSFGGSKSRHD